MSHTQNHDECFPTDGFDVVLANHMLHHVPDAVLHDPERLRGAQLGAYCFGGTAGSLGGDQGIPSAPYRTRGDVQGDHSG